MSIFNREKSAPPSASNPNPSPRPRLSERTNPAPSSNPTYVAAGSRVKGEITGSAEVRVDGELEGRLQLDSTAVVGKEGRVKGEIHARAVLVEGSVKGNVHGSERVEILASGSLEGDISSARVVIAEGAFFKGSVEMGREGGKGGGAAGGHAGSTAKAGSPEGSRRDDGGRQSEEKSKNRGGQGPGGQGQVQGQGGKQRPDQGPDRSSDKEAENRRQMALQGKGGGGSQGGGS